MSSPKTACPECDGHRWYCYKDIDDLGARLGVRNCQTCNEPADAYPSKVIDRRTPEESPDE